MYSGKEYPRVLIQYFFRKGKVKLANDKETGEQFAIKMIKKTLFIQKPEMEYKIAREIAVMRVISHPHTLTMYDVYENEEYMSVNYLSPSFGSSITPFKFIVFSY